MNTVDGRLIVIGGASRSGKTAYARKAAASAPRAAAWDPEDQWGKLPGWHRHTNASTFAAALLKPGPGRHAFVAPGELQPAFDYCCQCVFMSADRHGAITFIAEELADVSTPGKAPRHWGMLLRRGLKRGATIYAISQRWAEADKTAFGNASEFVLFSQPSLDDVRYITKKTRIPAGQLDALHTVKAGGTTTCHYLRYDASTRLATPGKLILRT